MIKKSFPSIESLVDYAYGEWNKNNHPFVVVRNHQEFIEFWNIAQEKYPEACEFGIKCIECGIFAGFSGYSYCLFILPEWYGETVDSVHIRERIHYTMEKKND